MGKLKKSFQDFADWYIRGYYHCDRCPYSWDERGEEDGDAGCFFFGELRDTCRLIRNPISQMIVNKRINEHDSQWAVWVGFADEYDQCEKVYKKIASDIENDMFVYAELHEFVSQFGLVDGTYAIMEIVGEYEKMYNPHKTPWEKLKEAYQAWKKDFVWRHFKRYFRWRGY